MYNKQDDNIYIYKLSILNDRIYYIRVIIFYVRTKTDNQFLDLGIENF